MAFTLSMATISASSAGTVKFQDNQLLIDGVPQPQLFGAELQYFRLRGGQGKNIPREKVMALWAQALDRMVEAKMNAISFYIPWDFHEYAEGKFDFSGTADEDGDGRADYPSRDVLTFFRMIEERGIKHVMARPGPYINAEWGFLGFGAIPMWFHDKHPDSHARNSKGQRSTLYSYHSPDFLRHSRTWLETVYRDVLRQHIGPGRPVSFLQIDNETNLMWQSVYRHDYSARAIGLYRDFLKSTHGTIANVNASHGRHWSDWSEITAPIEPGKNVAEDLDWYRFQDQSMFVYLSEIRKIWENLGVHEPQVLFTLAESYNATDNGVLPHYGLRNSRKTGMMTVNLYPKTYETWDQTLMNLPFKADHDVKAADAASDSYIGSRQEWVLGPEIQAGWWKGIHVSDDSRRQTYLTTIGHGLKTLFLYYFNEGDNWQHDWMFNATAPYFDRVKAEAEFRDVPEASLPHVFWEKLNQIVGDELIVADMWSIRRNRGTHPETLYFDAPLGPDAQARAPYRLVKEIGEKIVAKHGAFLGKARALEDAVCLIKDSAAHAPSTLQGVNSRIVQSDWAGGLLAMLMHAGVNPRFHHWGLNPKADLLDSAKCKIVIYQDTGFATPELIDTLAQVVDRGGSILSFIHTGVVDAIRASRPGTSCESLPTSPMNAVGFRCTVGIGRLYQARVAIYDVFNTDFYHQIHDARERRGLIDDILADAGITPQVRINGGGDRTVAFARTDGVGKELWITAKTSKREGFAGKIQWTQADRGRTYQVTDVLGGRAVVLSGERLAREGFDATLGGSGSTAFHVQVVSPPVRTR